MPAHSGNWERVVVAICALAFVLAILLIVDVFARDLVVISGLSLFMLFGGVFGELRETWNSNRPFSFARVFFRTFEWLSLAIAGYIVLSVIAGSGGLSG